MADNLTPSQRSYCMSRVKNRNTDIERCIATGLHRRGLRFRRHVRDLPGSPDIVFPSAKVAVFVDGDFWHGFRFPAWESSVSDFWRDKIVANRARDRRNFRRLQRMGWEVLRLWQHDVDRDAAACVTRVEARIKHRRALMSSNIQSRARRNALG